MKRGGSIWIIGILLLGIVSGGWLVANQDSVPVISDLLDKYAPKTTVELPTGNTDQNDDNKTSVAIGPTDIADVVERVTTAVVNIETTVTTTTGNPFFDDPFFREFFGDSAQPQTLTQTGMGTGTVITRDGYILTNYHVVQGASAIKVKLVGSNEPLPAEIIGFDDQLDLAIIKIEGSNSLPFLILGNSDSTRVGDWVVAIGNPYGLDHTVTAGVISAKERPITIEGKEYKHLIQTDAAINPGNSGGPLINISGEVIAINTAVSVDAQGIGFAIPINTAKEILDDLINKGKVVRPYMGVYLRDLSQDLADYLGATNTEGALVAEIMANSPASKAGLVEGDIVISLNGKSISNSSDLTERISDLEVGQKINIEILRAKKKVELTMILEEKP